MTVLRDLAWYFRLEWRRYAGAIAILVVVDGLVLLPPWIAGRLVDAAAAGTLTAAALAAQVAAVLVIGLLLYGLRYLWRQFLYSASYRLGLLLRRQIYDHFTAMDPAFFQRFGSGDLMARATNDIGAVEMTAGEGVLSLVDGALTAVVVLAVLFIALNWKLTLLALLPWPIMGYILWRLGRALHTAFGHAQAEFGALNERVQEDIGAIRLLKAFGREAQAEEGFAAAAGRTTAANLAVARVDACYTPVIHLTVGSSFLLTVAGGAWLIHHGQLSIGALTSFTLYLGHLIWPMFAFGWLLNIVERGGAAYARIRELLATPPAVADRGTRDAPPHAGVVFAVRRFAYPGSDRPLLHDIHLDLPAGHTLGIVGPIGCGKSTLLQLLPRLYEHPEAEVRLGGHPLADYRLAALRGRIAYVPQEPFLFSASVAENIALGRPDAERAAIRAAAQAAGVEDDILGFLQGYDTWIGERGVTVSGGQRQRIALARALLLDAPILLLDDALSAVDAATEHRILRTLRAEQGRRTVIIATHRLSAVTAADHILVLRQGRVAEQGNHSRLLAVGGWYAQTYQYQQLERAVEAGW